MPGPGLDVLCDVDADALVAEADRCPQVGQMMKRPGGVAGLFGEFSTRSILHILTVIVELSRRNLEDRVAARSSVLAEQDNIVAVEMTGLTLELVNRLDPAWVEELRNLLQQGRCTFVGSGYAQIIGPLVPAAVNHWNQRLGMELYEKALGIRPKIALVNEQAYSSRSEEHTSELQSH